MRKREFWQVEAVLIGIALLGIIGLWITRSTPDF
jgi:preprotein translocase subunit Sss1